MVECTGLENQRTARYRGFESLRLRKNENPYNICVGFFCFVSSVAISLLTYMGKPPIKSKRIHSALSFDYIPFILILIKI